MGNIIHFTLLCHSLSQSYCYYHLFHSFMTLLHRVDGLPLQKHPTQVISLLLNIWLIMAPKSIWQTLRWVVWGSIRKRNIILLCLLMTTLSCVVIYTSYYYSSLSHFVFWLSDVRSHLQQGYTALHCASYNGHLSIVQCLVTNDAQINLKDNVSGICGSIQKEMACCILLRCCCVLSLTSVFLSACWFCVWYICCAFSIGVCDVPFTITVWHYCTYWRM